MYPIALTVKHSTVAFSMQGIAEKSSRNPAEKFEVERCSVAQ